MQGVNPILVTLAERTLAKSPYDMTIPWMGGFRNVEDQKEIFKMGNSKCDGVKNKSKHQIGNALDVEPVGYNKENFPKKQLAKARNKFAQLMFTEWQLMISEGITKGYILEWGGLWGSTGWDKPHYQIVKK